MKDICNNSLTKATLDKQYKTKLQLLVFQALTVFGFSSITPLLLISNANAGNCVGSSCTGGDPSTMKCTTDAYTTTRTVRKYWNSLVSTKEVVIELRYSPSCKAVWNRSGEVMSGSRLWLEKSGSSQKFSEFTTQGRGSYYTNMLSANTPIKACVYIPSYYGSTTACTDYWKP
jgi:Zn-finger nucleic acid-binding protein